MRPASPVLFIPPSKTNTKYFGRHLRETDTAAEVSKLERTGIIKEAGEGLLQIRNSGLNRNCGSVRAHVWGREVGWRSRFVAILFYSRPLTYILHPIYIGMVTHFTFGT